MQFWMSLLFEPYDQLIAHAQLAEELGFEGVVLPDHVVILEGDKTPHPTGYPLQADEAFPDVVVAFAAMAQATSTLRFMSHVLVVPLRDPFVLAKQLGTLALFSGNRVVLGTGVGWLREEFETVGHGWSDRGARMDEMLDIMQAFWNDGYAEHHGTHYEFDRSGMFPVPTQPVPVVIGGHSEVAARRAARFDGYMPMRMLDEQTRHEFALIDALRAEQGRTGPYERIVPWFGADRAEVARIADEDGITGMMAMPWPMNSALSLDEKHAAARSFADTMITGP